MHTRFIHIVTIIAFTGVILASCKPEPIAPKQQDNSTLQISIADEPSSLDPRHARSLTSTSLMRLFFEGLMRKNLEGQLIPGLADKVEISPDGKTYTFTLRESYWSNDDPVTADDFVYTWKSILDPNFSSANAYQLYVIKGAKAAKEGLAPLDQIGIYSKGPATLVVEMENPTPYFLELTAFHSFFPVNRHWVKNHSDWANGDPSLWVSNGPFKLEKWAHHNVIQAERNPRYWDAAAVNLDKIALLILDDHTAFQMFLAGDLDWTGSPHSTLPPDAISSLKKEGLLNSAPGAGTHWFRINTEKAPFTLAKMRRAFSYALDRQAIVDHVLQGYQTPATGIVPAKLGLQEESPYFKDNDLPTAQKLFQESLDELQLTKETLPLITLTYAANERSHKVAQAVQQQWQKAFQILVNLESIEGKVYFDRLSHHDYQIGIGSWFADFKDPYNFLSVFKLKENGTNNTQWENSEYIALLDSSNQEMDPIKRKEILRKAEILLVEESPVIPIFYSTFNYVKKDRVHGVILSELGYLDFKYAYLDDDE